MAANNIDNEWQEVTDIVFQCHDIQIENPSETVYEVWILIGDYYEYLFSFSLPNNDWKSLLVKLEKKKLSDKGDNIVDESGLLKIITSYSSIFGKNPDWEGTMLFNRIF